MLFGSFWYQVRIQQEWKMIKFPKVIKFSSVAIANELKFDSLIASVYFEANQKLSVLSILPKLSTFD